MVCVHGLRYGLASICLGGEEHSLTALENNTKARFQGVGVGG